METKVNYEEVLSLVEDILKKEKYKSCKHLKIIKNYCKLITLGRGEEFDCICSFSGVDPMRVLHCFLQASYDAYFFFDKPAISVALSFYNETKPFHSVCLN